MKTLILGGGISGLSAAWFLRKKDPHAQITLLEKTDRLGGWIQTVTREEVLFEKGPRTFLTRKCPQLLSLIQEVGLEKELIFSDPHAAKRYLWTDGQLCSLSSFWPRLLLPLLKEPWIPSGREEDESIHAFATRRFNSWVADTLFDPLTLGIYAGDSKTLSLRSCFPLLFDWERTHGSLLKGAFRQKKGAGKGLFTLRRGMQTLIDAIQQKLNLKVVYECPVERIEERGVYAGGRFWDADRILCALPRSIVAKQMGTSFLEQSIWVISLAYSTSVLPCKGYGYLIPSKEKQPVLGMIWDSEVFPQQKRGGETKLTVMIRSEVQNPVEEALAAASLHLGIRESPFRLTEHFARDAIPQFPVGYRADLKAFEEEVGLRFPRLTLLGNYFESPSVEACVQRSNFKINSL